MENRTTVLLELNYQADQKIRISPAGDFAGFDGREFRVDAAAVVAMMQKRGLDIPLDENHNFGKALGWFDHNSMEAREDGIYAALLFNEFGTQLNESRAYRYLSPVYEMDGYGSKTVLSLHSVGMVNTPNLLNTPLNTKEMNTMDETKLDALQAQIDEIKTQNAELLAKLGESGEDEIEEPDRESNTMAAELAALRATVTEMNTKLSVFVKTNLDPNHQEVNTLGDEDKRIARMLGLSEDEYKGAK